MKSKVILFIVITILYSSLIFGQQNIITNNCLLGDTIVLKLDNSGDSISWQQSFDLINWTEISSQNLDSLEYIVNSAVYFRANVFHGSCNPYSSDVALLIPQDTSPCPSYVMDYDGNIYPTTLIGSQCWMARNLKVTHFDNGTAIPNVMSELAWNNISITNPAYCYYDNDPGSFSALYGTLYNWAAAMNGTSASNSVPSGVQGICPSGWHIPSDEEWKILEGAIDSLFGYPDPEWNDVGFRGFDAGKNLKSTSDWSVSGNGPDIYGFSTFPAGVRTPNGYFQDIFNSCYWWTASENINSEVWYRHLVSNHDDSYRNDFDKKFGCSVRCLKD